MYPFIRGKTVAGLVFLGVWLAGELPRMFYWFPLTVLDIAAILLILSSPLPKYRQGWYLSVVLLLTGSWLLGLRIINISVAVPGFVYLSRTIVYGWIVLYAKHYLGFMARFVYQAWWGFVLMGLGQYLIFPDARGLLKYGWDEHYWRLIGTVLDPNYMGVMLGLVGLTAFDKWQKQGKQSWGALGLASLLGLGLTFSRASWLAVGVGMMVYIMGSWMRSDRVRALAMILAIAGFVWFMAPKNGGEGTNIFRTASINQRLVSWSRGIEIWRKHPWLGMGFNNYAAARGDAKFTNHAGRSPDSSWILLVSAIGTIGAIGLIYVLWKPIIRADSWTLLILGVVGIHAVFNNTLFYPPVLALLAMIRATRR